MTICLASNEMMAIMIETDDSVPPRPGSKDGTVIVRVLDDKHWNGTTRNGCEIEIPRELLRDICAKV